MLLHDHNSPPVSSMYVIEQNYTPFTTNFCLLIFYPHRYYAL